MTTAEKMFNRKFKLGFNPFEPKAELMEAIKKERLSKSSFYNKLTKGKLLTELTMEQVEYVGLNLQNGSQRTRILAELYFFILMCENLEEQGLNDSDFIWALEEHFDSEFNVVMKRPKTSLDFEIEKHYERNE